MERVKLIIGPKGISLTLAHLIWKKKMFSIFVRMAKKTARNFILVIFMITGFLSAKSQVTDSTFHEHVDTIIIRQPDTLFQRPLDTALRIKNFTPYFTLHVDSTLDYSFLINRDPYEYYWYLKNSPVGLKIDKDNGRLRFKAEKSFFLSGKLKYDHEYKVNLGVQNLNDENDKLDTTFTLLFYNTDIIKSKIKPSVASNLAIEEGDTLSFRLQCEDGSFPLESMTFYSNFPIRSLTPVNHCGDIFTWAVPYDFVKDNEKEKERTLILKFVGVDKFFNRDTATINVVVRDAINYPQREIEYNLVRNNIEKYILTLKRTFRELDQKIKKIKGARTTFELSSASTALGGTVFSSLPGEDGKTVGKILPSVGVALVPVKEAVAPNKNYEQNSATLVRNSIKRLQYLLNDNMLTGDKDPNILQKINKLKDELKQIQVQLIDVPMADDDTDSAELEEYFNNPKVNKKYRLKGR